MRERLTKDKRSIERLLDQLDSTQFSRDNRSAIAAAYEQLKPYDYLRTYQSTLHAEKELQHRFASHQAHLEALLNRTNSSSPQQLHHARGAAQSAAYSASQVSVSASDFNRISASKEEAKQLFAAKYAVNDKRAEAACRRIHELTLNLNTDLREQGTRAIATDALWYIRREAEHILDGLDKHSYLTITGRGTWGSLEAAEQQRQHAGDCISIERHLVQIIRAAEVRPQSKQIIIGLRCNNRCDDLATMLQQYGTVHRFQFIPYLSLEADEMQVKDLFKKRQLLLREQDTIRPAHSYSVYPYRVEKQGEGWNLELIHAPEAWKHTRGEGTKVAVIDTGIDYRHPDLSGRFGTEKGADFTNNQDPLDDNGHGTHVAGTIAGKTTGVAPETTLYAVKVLDMYGSGSEVGVLQGMEWAIENHMDVMNMSLGSSWPSDAQAELIKLAFDRGIAVCCAAGNDGGRGYSYPASHNGAISIAAVDKQKQHAVFSNANDRVAVCAPGVAVYSTWLGGGYETLSGTSMASPHAAGLCALLRLRDDMSPGDMLQRTAEKLGDAEEYGAGLINAGKAVQL